MARLDAFVGPRAPSSLVELNARGPGSRLFNRGHWCIYRVSRHPAIAVSFGLLRRGAVSKCATTPDHIRP